MTHRQRILNRNIERIYRQVIREVKRGYRLQFVCSAGIGGIVDLLGVRYGLHDYNIDADAFEAIAQKCRISSNSLKQLELGYNGFNTNNPRVQPRSQYYWLGIEIGDTGPSRTGRFA